MVTFPHTVVKAGRAPSTGSIACYGCAGSPTSFEVYGPPTEIVATHPPTRPAGGHVPGYGLTALAFGVSALNASTGLCLGCKAYQLISRPEPA
jgi:hypothetical protein